MLEQLKAQYQYVMPQHTLSRMAGALGNCRHPATKRFLIDLFFKIFPDTDMSDVLEQDLNAYGCFNEFFTRRLKPDARPICQGANEIASPADGAIAAFGKIEENQLLQAKGQHFTLQQLLGNNQTQTQQFLNGDFITIYLAPVDYHRVHMPFQGKLLNTTYIPGKLFSVSLLTSRHIPGLFARNERIVCEFMTEQGPMIVILVGAMLVAGIHTAWSGLVTPNKCKTIDHIDYANENIVIERGGDLGHFEYGSTVIILTPKDKIQWQQSLDLGQHLKMGQAIAHWQ